MVRMKSLAHETSSFCKSVLKLSSPCNNVVSVHQRAYVITLVGGSNILLTSDWLQHQNMHIIYRSSIYMVTIHIATKSSKWNLSKGFYQKVSWQSSWITKLLVICQAKLVSFISFIVPITTRQLVTGYLFFVFPLFTRDIQTSN